MISKNDIVFNPDCIYDPVGRICFAQGRVFRAITTEYADDVLNFLNSDLYVELRKRSWVVNTWVAEDVSVEGYPLVLEHEQVVCVPTDIWTFEQWKDAAIFYVQLHDFCVQNGGTLNDARPSNIVFKNGHPLFIDFGSLIKLDESIKLNWERDFHISFQQTMYYLTLGEIFLANAWVNNAYSYYFDQWYKPSKPLEQSIEFKQVYAPVVDYYDCCLRQKRKHIKLHFYFEYKIIACINKVVRKLLKREEWNLIKYKLVFKKPTKERIVRLMNRYPCSRNMELTSLLLENRFTHIFEESLYNISPRYNQLLLYGNIHPQNIFELRALYNGEIFVISNDVSYMNSLYGYVQKNKLNIHIGLVNLQYELQRTILKALKSDLIYMSNDISKDITSEIRLISAASKVSDAVLTSSGYEMKDSDFMTKKIDNNYYLYIKR